MIGNQLRTFKRGGDFSVILSLPAYVEANYFEDWTPKAQMRKYQNDTSSGLIDDLVFEWLPESNHRSFRLTKIGTDNWPLGVAELDIMFTHEGKTTYTQTITIKIDRGITRKGAA